MDRDWESMTSTTADMVAWAQGIIPDSVDFFDVAKVRYDLPNAPFVYDAVKELMTRLVDSIDADAREWAEYICTRDDLCPKSGERILLPDNPQAVLTKFRKWVSSSPAIVIESWGEPEIVRVPMQQNVPCRIRWVYGDGVQAKVCMIDGQRMIALKRLWVDVDMYWVKEQEVLDAYVRDEVAQAEEYAKTLLVPPRKDDTVTDAMRVAIDIALALPEMKYTDDVLIVGVSQDAYDALGLMSGLVNSVTCVSEQIDHMAFTIDGTDFTTYKEEWDEKLPMISDVVIAESLKNSVNCVKVKARVFSLGVKERQTSGWDVATTSYRYVQLSSTDEDRLVSNPRLGRAPRGRFGNCAACRELDSVLSVDYMFSPIQRQYWRKIHNINAPLCSVNLMRLCKPSLRFYNCYPEPVRLALSVLSGRQYDTMRELRSLGQIYFSFDALSDKYVQVAVFCHLGEYLAVYVKGEFLPDKSFCIFGESFSVVPRAWSIWQGGQCVEAGWGCVSLKNFGYRYRQQRPF